LFISHHLQAFLKLDYLFFNFEINKRPHLSSLNNESILFEMNMNITAVLRISNGLGYYYYYLLLFIYLFIYFFVCFVNLFVFVFIFQEWRILHLFSPDLESHNFKNPLSSSSTAFIFDFSGLKMCDREGL
jgi:hypothetical protein